MLATVSRDRRSGRGRLADAARATTCARCELLMEAVEEPIVGTVTAQNGSSTTCNGWVASAVLGTLVIDAAGDGRAHPTGKMGSFGLAADDDYRDRAGGRGRQPRRSTATSRSSRAGTVRHTANVLRTASTESGGFIACARNPLPASFVAAPRRRRRDQLRARRSARRSSRPRTRRRRGAMIEATAEHLGGA